MIKIEINDKAGARLEKTWMEKIIRSALGKIGRKNAEISVAVVGGEEMKKLNNDWRGKNKVTDVLSFAYSDKPISGEIIICYPRAKHQAKERGLRASDEIKMLLVHGILHLCGYDHEAGEVRAKKMEGLQNQIMQSINR